MYFNLSKRFIGQSSVSATLILLVSSWTAIANAQDGERGAELYQQRCAACHDNPQDYIPPRATLTFRSADYVVDSMTEGVMKIQAQGLSRDDIESIAVYVTGKRLGAPSPGDDWQINFCEHKPEPIKENQFFWNGWGRDMENSRYQPNPGLDVGEIEKLNVKWAFAFPTGRNNSQPTLVGDRVFVSSSPGLLYALDAKTGCTHWTYTADTGARATVSVGALPNTSPTRYAVYIGTTDHSVHAVDADTGQAIWQTQIEDIPAARITGAPILYQDKLFVPMSSLEEGSARGNYECCKFRGSVVAIDASNGEQLWQTHSIDTPPQPFKVNRSGVQMYGPAGAAIWSSPTVDVKRNRVYAATGDSYTDVDEGGSDAIIAFDIDSGKMLWRNQVTDKDNFVVGCTGDRPHANCPEELGPDYDFGSSPIIRTLKDGKQIIFAGQKSGILYALDPDNDGKILWLKKLGVGATLGGIQWGFAADETTVYVPVSDVNAPEDTRRPGLTALDIETGEQLWHVPAPEMDCGAGVSPRRCSNAFSAAISVIPGAIFSGSMDGFLRAFSTQDGSLLWQVDAKKLKVDSVNGLTVSGGIFNATGPTIANGILYVNVGYGAIPNQPGNVLMAFSVDGK